MMYSDTKIVFPNLGGLTVDPPRGFYLGSLMVYFYGMIIAVGLILAVLYGLKRSRQFGLKQDDILDGVLWIVPVAIICARLYYVFSDWDQYAKNPIDILNIRQGGLAIYGGVIGAGLSVILFCKIKKVSLPAVLDLVAISFLIGQSIGRWGNFMNREAFGCYTDGLFAMRISESYLPGAANGEVAKQVELLKENAIAGGYAGFVQVHPTFLYESVWNVVGFVALHFLSQKRQYDGQMAMGYVAWYGLGRALIEGLRMDSLYWGPFRASQLLAAVTCLAAVVTLLLMNLRKHDPAKLFVNRLALQEIAAIQAELEEMQKPVTKEAEETEKAEACEETGEAEETEETGTDEAEGSGTDEAEE